MPKNAGDDKSPLQRRRGFIKTILLKIGTFVISILTVVGVVQSPPEPVPEPPEIVFEDSVENEDSLEEDLSMEREDAEEVQNEAETLFPKAKPSNLIENIEPVIESSPAISTGDINTLTREAVVNIFCVSRSEKINSITGSGIIIDPRGVILTNSHIAQYFLLEDLSDCLIRTGSPAENRYTAELLYVSPSWIKDNFSQITKENPRGTGENDFALLKISGRTNSDSSFPGLFPFVKINLDENNPEVGDSVLIAGYPAGLLAGSIIQNELNILSTIGKVSKIFTFKKNTVDVFSVFGSLLAQKGASGGAVIDMNGELIGIIVTATQGETTGIRELRAITLSHINRSFIEDFEVSLSSFLLGDIDGKAEQFQDLIAPVLKDFLLSALQ